MQIIGLETANGYVKVASRDKVECYVNRTKQIIRNDAAFLGEKAQTVYTMYDNLIEKGNYVLDPKGTSSAGRDSSRYETKEYLLESLIAISKVLNDNQVTVVVGVPARDYYDDKVKGMIKNTLVGRHILGINGEKMIIDIESVVVSLEPLGTLVDFIYDDNCNVRNNRLAFSYTVIDIGQGTTDVLCVDKNLKPILVKGFDIGCIDIINNALELINQRFDKTEKVFTTKDLSLELLKSETVVIEKYFEKFDVTKEFKLAKEIVASDIRSAIMDCGINLRDYDRTIYTGGGSRALEHNLHLGENTRIYPNAQIANVNGHVKFGMLKGY